MSLTAEEIKKMAETLKTALREPERQKPEAAPVVIRDIQEEAARQEAIAALAPGLRDSQIKLNSLLGDRGSNPEKSKQVSALQRNIADSLAMVVSDSDVCGKWIVGPLLPEFELIVSRDFVVRELLDELPREEGEKLDQAWREYFKLERQVGDEAAKGSRPERWLWKVRVSDPRDGREATYYFAKRRREAGQETKEQNGLLEAYATHFKDKKKRGRKFGRDLAKLRSHYRIDDSLVLRDAAQGKVGVLLAELTAEHDWKTPAGRTQTGHIVINSMGVENGVARLEFLDAMGPIEWSLDRFMADEEEGRVATVFQYLPNREFDGFGIPEADGRVREVKWLKLLLLKLGGFLRRREEMRKFTPSTPRFERGTRPEPTTVPVEELKLSEGSPERNRRQDNEPGRGRRGGRRPQQKERGGADNPTQRAIRGELDKE